MQYKIVDLGAFVQTLLEIDLLCDEDNEYADE